MRSLRAWCIRFASMFRRSRGDREFADELDSHLQMHVDDNLRAGLSPDAARRAAALALGGRQLTAEHYRERQRLPMLDTLLQDLSYAVRMLRRAPAFTAVAVVTLALGIGANTAIFSVVDAVLLRPLPYADSDRLAMVWEDVRLPAYQNNRNTPAPGNFHDWRVRNTVFSDLAAIGYRSWSVTGNGEPIRVDGEAVSAQLFSILQVQPLLGRTFAEDEDRPGGAHVALLGYSLWASRYGADTGIVGQTIRLNDEPYTVVGVMPKGFHFPDSDDVLWTPLALTPEQRANHGSHFLRVVGRLKPGITLAQASADLNIIAQRLTQEDPSSNTGVGVTIVSLRDQTVGDVRAALIVILALVGFLLLMVCANLGNLLLARASARSRELATRVALGAGRARLVRQLLTESALLAAIGGSAGLALAAWGVNLLRRFAPADLPRVNDISIDGAVIAFTAVASIAAGLAFGTIPALHATRDQPRDALAEGGRGTAGKARVRTRHLLVIVETALGVVVLVGAGLLLRSFIQLERIPLGFEPAHLLTFRVQLPLARYDTLAKRAAFYQQLAQNVHQLPGVRSSGAISFLPLTMAGGTTGVTIDGAPPPLPGHVPFVDFRSVTPSYFQTMGIPMVAGRDVSWDDTADRPAVIVVSEAMARTFWPRADPIGKRVKLGRPGGSDPWLTVVGVVSNVQQLDLKTAPRPAMYVPALQGQGTGDTLRDWVVRTPGDPESLASAVRAAVWRIDAELPISRMQTMDHLHAAYLGPQQFNLVLVALFGLLALVLAAAGLYGVTAYAVEQRTHELGVRIALGAQRIEILRLVVGDGATLAAIGVAIGSAAALATARVMGTMLFGIGARDPITFSAVAGLLLLVALIACYVPARRAAGLDPIHALRSE